MTWDGTYEAVPADTDLANLYASIVRELKARIRTRMERDHEWADDTQGGKHKHVTFMEQVGDATTNANEIALYAKDDGFGETEIYVRRSTLGTVTKITGPGGLLLDDHSATNADQLLATSPGASGAQVLPVTMNGEVETLRYALKRMGLGAHAKHAAGATEAGWFDGNTIGPDLSVNGSILDNRVTPFNWTVDGAPATQELLTLPVGEGKGKYLHIADAAGSTADGAGQSFVGLKANTVYLVEARVLATTALAVLKTTGAVTSAPFDNLAVPSSGAGFQTLSGIILTDNTPATIGVAVRPSANNYDIGIASITFKEVVSVASGVTNDQEGVGAKGVGRFLQTVSDNHGTVGGFAADTTAIEAATVLAVVPDGPGYQIEVEASASFENATGDAVTLRLQEKIDGGAFTTVATHTFSHANSGAYVLRTKWLRGADSTNTITPGSVYQYRISAACGSPGSTRYNGDVDLHRLIVCLSRVGNA